MNFFQTTLVRLFFDIFPTIDKLKLSQFQFPETTEIENSNFDGVQENVTLSEIFPKNIQGDVQRASFAPKKQPQLHIAKPRTLTPAPIFNALPDLAPVVHRVDNNYSPKWRWLARGDYLPRPRVSIQGVPKVHSSNFMHYNFWSKIYFYMKFPEDVYFPIENMYSEFQ